MRGRLVLIALSLIFPSPSGAADGALEINQTCALQTGCFAGDTPAFPVLITMPGSYRLTSNLILPNENSDGILVQASDVSIDLGGFAIVRSGCEATTADCTPTSGTGAGIRRSAASRRAISVRDGSITGMGDYGIVLGQQAEVRNVRARWNRTGGIFADIGSTIVDSLAFQNGGDGIDTSPGKATISGCRADGNGGIGIRSGDDASISRSAADQNGVGGINAGNASRVSDSTANYNLNLSPWGIRVGTGSVVTGSTASFNSAVGIDADPASTVSDSTASGNSSVGIRVGSGSTVSNSTASQNGDHGIFAGSGSLVHGNTVRQNGDAGLTLGDKTAYRENVITLNSGGTVIDIFVGTFVNLGSNLCADASNDVVACP